MGWPWILRNETPAQCSVRSSHIPFNAGKTFLMSLAKESDGGRGTSLSVKTMRTPPANVMDCVGSGACGAGAGAGNDVAVENCIDGGIGRWGLNVNVSEETGGGLEGASTC